MTDPITPPPELVQQWYQDADQQLAPYYVFVAHCAAHWAANQELEACCLLLDNGEYAASYGCHDGTSLRAARRPKPPSLKEQALTALLHLDQGQHNERCLIIRRALEQLDD